MKINMTLGQRSLLNGYINIDPTYSTDGILSKENINLDIKKADVRNLDELADDAECTEIIVNSLYDFLNLEDAVNSIKHLSKKLRHKGKIVLIGSDARELCRKFVEGSINIINFNEEIHGSFEETWDVKMSHFTMESMSELLESLGLQVVKKRLDNYNYLVEAIRP